MYKRITAIFLTVLLMPRLLCVCIMRLSASVFSVFSFPVYPFAVLFLFALLIKGHLRTVLCICFAFTLFYMKGFPNAPYPLYADPTKSDIEDLCTVLNKIVETVDRTELPLSEILRISGEIMDTAPPKEAKRKEFLNAAGISGIYIPFTGEAFVNPDEAQFLLPFTAVHELCHRLGFSDEGQANIHAFIKCMLSGNDAFVYSACVYALNYANAYLNEYEKSIPEKPGEDAQIASDMPIPIPDSPDSFFGNYSDIVRGLVSLMKDGFFYPITSQGVI